ncbi:hypothetical protein GCM10008967_27690 [Bacillus carboniphilus]|uniref:YuzL family protein n=1 Tax=Bacillus carboniphilus TaxID=86663 RepID=A0ABP3G635_9BACI
MKRAKKDPSKIGMSSPNVEGQGTTTSETGSKKMDSARKQQRRT